MSIMSFLHGRRSPTAKSPVVWEGSIQHRPGTCDSSSHSNSFPGTSRELAAAWDSCPTSSSPAQLPVLLPCSQQGLIPVGAQCPSVGGLQSGAPALVGYMGGTNLWSRCHQQGAFSVGLPVGAPSWQDLRQHHQTAWQAPGSGDVEAGSSLFLNFSRL